MQEIGLGLGLAVDGVRTWELDSLQDLVSLLIEVDGFKCVMIGVPNYVLIMLGKHIFMFINEY